MSRPLPVIMAVVVFVMLLSCTVPPPKVSEISCQGVARHWIGEVAPNSDGLATEVLEISNLQESSRVVNEFKNSLECTGDAKFANQTWYNVVVGYFKDADGEHWYEIQAVGKIPEPTTPKTLENPDSTKASRATPARQSTPQPTPQPTQTPDSFPSLECSDLSPRVIDEAKYFPDPFLELLMAEKISHDDAKIICRGVVKTESGLESPISFYATNYEGFGIDELSLSDYSCEYLAVQAINVSESIEYDPKLLKIFDSEESSRVANQFQNSLGCTGKVKTTDGTYTITFSGRIDGDELWVEFDLSVIESSQMEPTPYPTQTPTQPTPTPDPYVAASNGLRLLEWTAYENFGSHYIRGVVENPSKSYRSESHAACLYFDLYDSQGYFKGDAQVTISDSIPPTRKLKFDEYLTDVEFSLLEFTGFRGCWD